MPLCPKCKKHFGNYDEAYKQHIATCGRPKTAPAVSVLDTPLEVKEMEKVLAQRELEWSAIIKAKDVEIEALKKAKFTLEKSVQGYKGATGALQKTNAVKKEEIELNKKAFNRMKKLLVPHSNETFEWRAYSIKEYTVKSFMEKR